MTLFLVVLLTVGLLHACGNYASHKSVAQAIENGLEWTLFTYVGSYALLIVFVLLATHFGWFGSGV